VTRRPVDGWALTSSAARRVEVRQGMVAKANKNRKEEPHDGCR
jgi:hypothetical protein